MVSLHFKNVSKFFGKTAAVSEFSLEIKAGELFFLLGPSGCGKTTCLRMVAGFLAPDAGTLHFNERQMNGVAPHLRNTGMVFQNYALWPHLNVRGNVEYGLRARKTPKAEMNKRTDDALKMVQLSDLAERFPNQLSGGQQQRVALARALVINPDVLLLDEPLSNLDAQLRLEMRREIKRLHDETQTTALYVTHDQDEALSVADRIGVMRGGVLQQVGTPRELYRLPQTRFVAGFLGESNFLPGVLKSFDAREMHVETAVGEIVAARQDTRQWRENQNVFCSIRPEAWQLSEEGASTRGEENLNRFAVKLHDVTYLGEVEQWQMQLVGGRESALQGEDENWRDVKISRLNPPLQAPPRDAVFQLRVAARDVVVLPE